MLIEKEKVEKAFQNYVEGYNHKEPRIKLKIEHTNRVAMLCERIATSLKLSEEQIKLAWLIGMLHDIGRFEQLKNFDTFIDAKSINHAHYGVKILFEDGLIRNFIEQDAMDAIIRDAIYYHNAYQLPVNLDTNTKLFCDLIRDADKIDILKINVEIPLETIYDFTTEQIKTSVVSTEVMESYFKHQAVKHSRKKTPLDHVVGHISLAFELVYPISIEIAKEQGYVKQMLQFNPDNQVAKEQFERLEQEMKDYFKVRKEI